MQLEWYGFKVLVATADGASPNRTFMPIHRDRSGSIQHKVLNPFSSSECYIHFVSDLPHLLKTEKLLGK